jgi:hypothetical protein
MHVKSQSQSSELVSAEQILRQCLTKHFPPIAAERASSILSLDKTLALTVRPFCCCCVCPSPPLWQQGAGSFMFQLPEAKKLLHKLLMEQHWWVTGQHC